MGLIVAPSCELPYMDICAPNEAMFRLASMEMNEFMTCVTLRPASQRPAIVGAFFPSAGRRSMQRARVLRQLKLCAV